jgi:hypothetical protein
MKFGTPHRRLGLRLAFTLLVPCLLLQLKIRNDTEPYPAILLPSGASLIKTSGRYTAVERKCVAEDSTGRQYAVPIASILNAVPSDYHPYVLEAGFGITKDRMERHLPIPFLGRVNVGRHKTPTQIDETRAWLRMRIRKTIGIDAVRIHVLTYEVTTYYNDVAAREQRVLKEDNRINLLSGA